MRNNDAQKCTRALSWLRHVGNYRVISYVDEFSWVQSKYGLEISRQKAHQAKRENDTRVSEYEKNTTV